MNNKQQHRIDNKTIEDKAQKILSVIENPATQKDLNVEEKEIIQRIANLSSTEDFDRETQFAIISRKIQKMELRKKITSLYGRIASGVAAVVLIFILSVFWINHNKNLSQQNDNLASADILRDADNNESVTLTLRDGSVVDLTEKEKTGVSIEDSIFREKALIPENVQSQTELKYNTIEVPKTKDFTLLLADGTVVKINSDSRIKFPDKFSETERHVILEEGEAFFDVARNDKVPFVVEVKDSRITVMGTSFNVNAYPEYNMKTTLVEGKVKIGVSTSSKEITLTPGQQAELRQGDFKVANVDVDPYIAWTRGLFMFNKLDLKSIMTQLNRWYNINVTFDDPAIEFYTFTGVINKQYSKEQIFRLIEKTTQISIEVRNDNDVFITKD